MGQYSEQVRAVTMFLRARLNEDRAQVIYEINRHASHADWRAIRVNALGESVRRAVDVLQVPAMYESAPLRALYVLTSSWADHPDWNPVWGDVVAREQHPVWCAYSEYEDHDECSVARPRRGSVV